MSARERVVLDASDIDRALTRISHEILESEKGADNICILGIQTTGVPLANRIAGKIADFESVEVPVGELDITMFRDDLRLRPARSLAPTRLPDGGIEDKIVVLVDDVFFSGRTVRAALDALGEIGRPAKVRLATLVDRGHRELPVRADFVGKNIPTSLDETVRVSLVEIDGVDEVVVGSTGPAGPGPAAVKSANAAPNVGGDAA
ncbi:MAG: bifunctional pyr operon transcriptional regulator/uracil phosphoribosyltransferase PyrR [Candidatus Nanopelagicales bacterium]